MICGGKWLRNGISVNKGLRPPSSEMTEQPLRRHQCCSPPAGGSRASRGPRCRSHTHLPRPKHTHGREAVIRLRLEQLRDDSLSVLKQTIAA